MNRKGNGNTGIMIVHNRRNNRRQLWNGKQSSRNQNRKMSPSKSAQAGGIFAEQKKGFELQTFTIINREDKSTAISTAICEHSISSNISHACYKHALTWSIYKTSPEHKRATVPLKTCGLCFVFYITRLRPPSSRRIPRRVSREHKCRTISAPEPRPNNPAQR